MKTIATKDGIKAGDEVVLGKNLLIVAHTWSTADGEDVVELYIDGYSQADRMVAASDVHKSSYQVLADQYGVTAGRIHADYAHFIDSEGYIERGGKMIECENFDTWLQITYTFSLPIPEPYQKGDLGIL